MKLVIAYTPSKIRPEVKQFGDDMGAIFENVGHSETAYGELVAGLWEQGESVLLCEHDVLPSRRLVEEMISCESEWCAAFAWRYSGAVAPGETKPQRPFREKEFGMFLGKFSADLIRRTPQIVGAVRGRYWTQVDLAVLGALAPQVPCVHGPVVHLRQQAPGWTLTLTEKDWADG